MDIEEIVLELIGPTANYPLVEYWITKACNSIIKYLNKDITVEECKTNYAEAIIELVILYNQDKQQGNIKSMSQGSRSISYATEEEAFQKIKRLLPKPYVRLF